VDRVATDPEVLDRVVGRPGLHDDRRPVLPSAQVLEPTLVKHALDGGGLIGLRLVLRHDAGGLSSRGLSASILSAGRPPSPAERVHATIETQRIGLSCWTADQAPNRTDLVTPTRGLRSNHGKPSLRPRMPSVAGRPAHATKRTGERNISRSWHSAQARPCHAHGLEGIIK
jgi:hypothetical protein